MCWFQSKNGTLKVNPVANEPGWKCHQVRINLSQRGKLEENSGNWKKRNQKKDKVHTPI